MLETGLLASLWQWAHKFSSPGASLPGQPAGTLHIGLDIGPEQRNKPGQGLYPRGP